MPAIATCSPAVAMVVLQQYYCCVQLAAVRFKVKQVHAHAMTHAVRVPGMATHLIVACWRASLAAVCGLCYACGAAVRATQAPQPPAGARMDHSAPAATRWMSESRCEMLFKVRDSLIWAMMIWIRCLLVLPAVLTTTPSM